MECTKHGFLTVLWNIPKSRALPPLFSLERWGVGEIQAAKVVKLGQESGPTGPFSWSYGPAKVSLVCAPYIYVWMYKELFAEVCVQMHVLVTCRDKCGSL